MDAGLAEPTQQSLGGVFMGFQNFIKVWMPQLRIGDDSGDLGLPRFTRSTLKSLIPSEGRLTKAAQVFGAVGTIIGVALNEHGLFHRVAGTGVLPQILQHITTTASLPQMVVRIN